MAGKIIPSVAQDCMWMNTVHRDLRDALVRAPARMCGARARAAEVPSACEEGCLRRPACAARVRIHALVARRATPSHSPTHMRPLRPRAPLRRVGARVCRLCDTPIHSHILAGCARSFRAAADAGLRTIVAAPCASQVCAARAARPAAAVDLFSGTATFQPMFDVPRPQSERQMQSILKIRFLPNMGVMREPLQAR